MATSDVQIGWIPYLNLHPMHQEVCRIASGSFPLLTGHPTTVNKWLCDGRVGIAPSSSINLLKSENLEVALPLGIASEGKVLSVYIGAYREHAAAVEFINRRHKEVSSLVRDSLSGTTFDIRRLAQRISQKVDSTQIVTSLADVPSVLFTPASAASAALTKIFLRMWFGEQQAAQMCRSSADISSRTNFISGNRPMELVIGDEALARRSDFAYIIDLGELWWEMTGLPFVFAIWQSSQLKTPAGMSALLLEAANLSAARMKIEPQIYYPDPRPLDRGGNPIDLAAYWRVIQYKLTQRHLQGLLLYLALYTEWNEVNSSASVPLRMARWEGAWSRV